MRFVYITQLIFLRLISAFRLSRSRFRRLQRLRIPRQRTYKLRQQYDTYTGSLYSEGITGVLSLLNAYRGYQLVEFPQLLVRDGYFFVRFSYGARAIPLRIEQNSRTNLVPFLLSDIQYRIRYIVYFLYTSTIPFILVRFFITS